MREVLERLCAREHLSRAEARAVFARLLEGQLSDVEMAALLVALRVKGEHPDEIAGAAEAMRAAARPFARPDYGFADSCGTGGDGAHTLNVSTAVALVAAEAGVKVAKHGNRSVSSRCGSADVLEELGLRLEVEPALARRCLDAEDVGLCFLFAPYYHAGLRHAMAVRRGLGTRTLLNLLGPLLNPASPRWQVVGVYDGALCAPVARTLALLGCEAALVVHGDGLDELALHGPSRAALWRGGALRELEIDPEGAVGRRWPREALRGADRAHNAAALRALLQGQGEPAYQDAVALNTGALLWLCGVAADLREGVERARAAQRGGGAYGRLLRLVEVCRGA